MRHEMGDATLLTGCCLDVLSGLPDSSVNCCVTSPPYFGLRDYGNDGQIGLEPTPDEFVAALVDVFREVRRVLRDDATLWLNLGDSYASFRDAKCVPNTVGGGQKAMPTAGARNRSAATFSGSPVKHKDLIGIPWRVAFALQADGWYLRQDIIWHKPNPMPESVKDRCTKAHEYIFLLSKSARYWYDAEAIAEPVVREWDSSNGGNLSPSGVHKANGTMRERGGEYPVCTGNRNRRSVWTVATQPYSGAHFATFPPSLIEPCILAGCPAGGTVLDPFSGSGTTGQVALQQGRKYIGIELNPEYQALAVERIKPYAAQARLFA